MDRSETDVEAQIMLADPVERPAPVDAPRYILVTQCLQNDFFLNRECRIGMSDLVVRKMLLGRQHYDLDLGTGSRRSIARRTLEQGPLGIFLEQTIGRRADDRDGDGTLHVINIRDWHEPNESYDGERRAYGAHCERGTWGARYIDGLDDYLDPRGRDGCFDEAGTVRIYHVHADSLFDFRPRFTQIGDERKFNASPLEDLVDVLTQGSDDDLRQAAEILRERPQVEALHELAEKIGDADAPRTNARIYLAVIGVYTDLKVKTVLTGLRTRYNLPNLAVSDTLCASTALERHLEGLDFASKVLGVEVIHGINDLVRFLGGTGDLEDESEIIANDPFARYQSFFLDRQNVLAYQSDQLQEYLRLTERRAVDVYESVRASNRFLVWWGGAFLVATLVLAVASALHPQIPWQISAVTGGVSLVQFVGTFFSRSLADMQRNLTNLAAFKMMLESHSLKMAFARYHLTTPQSLRELQTDAEAKAAARQLHALEEQLRVIREFERGDLDGLRGIGLLADDEVAVEEPPELVPAGAEKS